MTLSITRRLTLTVAVLSALIMAPLTAVLYWTVKRSAETTAFEQAHLNAFDVDNRIWQQLDEDILADFGGAPVLFDRLTIPFDHWAIVRGNGRPEIAHGLFQSQKTIQVDRPAEIMQLTSGDIFAIASTRLIPDRPMTWADIPKAAQSAVIKQVPNGVFLWVKKDVAGSHFVFAVQMLSSLGVTEVQVTDEGQQIQTQTTPLPTSLPQDMEVHTPEGQILQEPRIVGWHSANSELIVEIQGRSSQGESLKVALNRFGEYYALQSDGRVGPRLDPSRLWVVVAHDWSSDMARVRFMARIIVMGSLLVWLLMMSIAWLVTRHALKPVNEMVIQASRIDTSKLNERLPVGPAEDELSRIARTVNKMLDRLQDGYHREQQFIGDASHEMRNPLTKMTAEIDLALSRPRNLQDYEATLNRLRQYTQGMQHLMDSLLTLTRLDGHLQNLDIQPFDVADLAVEVLKSLSESSHERIQFVLGETDRPMQAIGHRELIGVLLSNLLDNALRYSPVDSSVDLRIHTDGRTIHFEIEDRGSGIPEELRQRVFHRFHRLETSRSKQTGGTGLGLSIVKAIADVHHTRVTVSTGQSGLGTLAAFTLPVFHDQAQRGK